MGQKQLQEDGIFLSIVDYMAAESVDSENILNVKWRRLCEEAAQEVEATARGGWIREIVAAGDLPFRAWNPVRPQTSALLSVSTV